MVTQEGKLFRYLQVRAMLRSQPLFSKLAQTVLCVRNDEPALMEFLVTVKNRREWVRVMMLSVTARSHTDRWREWRGSRKAVSGKHESCHITNLCASVITPPNRNGLRRGHFSLINQSSIQFANKHNHCINTPKKKRKKVKKWAYFTIQTQGLAHVLMYFREMVVYVFIQTVNCP